MRRIAVFAVMVGVLFCGRSVVAFHIDVSPLFPTESTPVSIKAWALFGDPGQKLVSATYLRSGLEIDMTVIMQDMHNPEWVFPAVVTPGGGSVDCGLLPAGLYGVTANMWMIPWGSDTPDPFFRSGNTSFAVIPEPSALVLLAIGGVGLLSFTYRRRDRS